MLMNRLVFSSLLMLGVSAMGVQSYADEPQRTVGQVPQVLRNVRNLPQTPYIRVLIAQQRSSFQVEVQGAHNVYDPYTGKKLDAAFMKSAYQMKPTADGIKWGQEFPGVFQVLVVPDSKQGTIIVDGVQYAGAMAFYEVGDKLACVNWLSLDDLTSSLMSTVVPPEDPEHKEALAAMAIAVRSLAYDQLLHATNPFWDVRADACGYKGRAVVRQDVPFQEAVQVTKNIIFEPEAKSNVQLTTAELERVKHMIPHAQAVEMAANGKDASMILERFMPGKKLEFISQE